MSKGQSFQKRKREAGGHFPIRRPRAKKEEEEFGPGRADYIICPQCRCVYFDKSWYHSLEEDVRAGEASKKIGFQLCPACRMINDERYEGEIILEDVPERLREEIKTLAEAFGKRAFSADPLDRVISIEEREVRRPSARRKRGAPSRKEVEGRRDIRILTTENQLAKRLAKKINEVFGRKLKVSISHSRDEDIVRVTITF